mmetsp:Transcript_21815/g.33752  ORF Transcript_21815/g.33752 Transcript_21815/m.33752 type:complete len:290 (-) Transcript_21815:521-1390(-)
MEEHLTVGESRRPLVVHHHFLDHTQVISLADGLDHRLSGYLIGSDGPPPVVPHSIIDTHCEVVRADVDMVGLNIQVCLANNHVVTSAVHDGDLCQRRKESGVALVARVQLRYHSQEPEEVAAAGGHTHNGPILGPVELSDGARALGDVDAVLHLLEPVGAVEELDLAHGSDGHLLHLLVDGNLFDGAHRRAESMELLAVRHLNDRTLSSLESAEQFFFIEPVELDDLAIGLFEFDEGMRLGLRVVSEDLGAPYDAAHDLGTVFLDGAPLHVARLGLQDESIERRVTLVI